MMQCLAKQILATSEEKNKASKALNLPAVSLCAPLPPKTERGQLKAKVPRERGDTLSKTRCGGGGVNFPHFSPD